MVIFNSYVSLPEVNNCDLGKKGCADGYWMPVNRTGGIILNDATRFKPCTLKMANFQSPHVFCSEV